MTPDDKTNALPSDADAAPDSDPILQRVPHAASTLEAPALRANLSAIGTAEVGALTTNGSAIGMVNATGDVDVNTSVVPIVSTKGNARIHLAYTSAVVVGGDIEMKQAGAAVIVGRELDVDQGGSAVMIAGDAAVRNGAVGVLLSRSAEVSDNSRVLIGTKAAIIIALALLGGFGLVAIVMALGVRRVMGWRPQINMPALPELPHWAELRERLRRNAA